MGDVIERGLRADADGDGKGADEGAEESEGLGEDRSRSAPRSVKAERDQAEMSTADITASAIIARRCSWPSRMNPAWVSEAMAEKQVSIRKRIATAERMAWLLGKVDAQWTSGEVADKV